MKTTHRSFLLGLLAWTAVANCAEIDLKQYSALNDPMRVAPRIGAIDDLRLQVQNGSQLSLLEKGNAVLLKTAIVRKEELFSIAPEGSVSEALDALLQKANLKKLDLKNGFFRIYDHPTARITIYTRSAIFYGRPHPRSILADEVARHDAMMRYKLRAGDVLVLDLVGLDP